MGNSASNQRQETLQAEFSDEMRLHREENRQLKYAIFKSSLQNVQMSFTDILLNGNGGDVVENSHRFLADITNVLANGNEENLIDNLNLLFEAARDVLDEDSSDGDDRIQLIRGLEPLPLQETTVALLGPSSCGKSSLAHTLIPVESEDFSCFFPEYSTDNVRYFYANRFSILDCPGRNDETTYLEMKYIRLWKSATHRLVFVLHTIKEMKNLLKLFDQLGLNSLVIVNKFDRLKPDEVNRFKKQISEEFVQCGFRCVKSLCFISAENPRQYQDDWMKMMNYIT